MDFLIYKLLSLAVLLFFSIILSLQDLKRMSVNVFLQILAILSAVLCQLLFAKKETGLYLLSALLMVAFYYIVRKISKGKLGAGDILFGCFQGLFLKPLYLPVCMAIEVFTSLLFIKKYDKEKAFPFIPFMAIGLILTWLLQTILNITGIYK